MLKPDKAAAPSIGIVLTCYKRPHLLTDQLQAIRRQSVPASEVVIWDNGSGADIASWPLHDNESVVRCSKNWGVWPRFLFAACLKTEYVAVFDDDTMPGHDWLSNCLDTIEGLPTFSLLGAVGVLFPDGTRANRGYVGWKNPMNEAVHADIVGHAWFCRRELLDWFVIDHDAGPTFGEDYTLSARARELGGVVACPPHPPNDLAKWGSLRGLELGSDEHALYRQPAEECKKTAVHEALRKRGWKVVTEVYGG